MTGSDAADTSASPGVFAQMALGRRLVLSPQQPRTRGLGGSGKHKSVSAECKHVQSSMMSVLEPLDSFVVSLARGECPKLNHAYLSGLLMQLLVHEDARDARAS